MGEVGPPQIVDMFDCYSVAEGGNFIFITVWAERLSECVFGTNN